MDEEVPPEELVVRLRPRAGLWWPLTATALGLVLAVMSIASAVDGDGVNLLWVLYAVFLPGQAWWIYRLNHRQSERLRIGPAGLTERQGPTLPWADVARLRWQPPRTATRLLGSAGRFRLLTETQRRFAERHGLEPSARTIPLWGLDHDPQHILAAVARHAPRLVGPDSGQRDPETHTRDQPVPEVR